MRRFFHRKRETKIDQDSSRRRGFQSALIIDDDPLTQIISVEALNHFGVPIVQTADNGKHGLDLFDTADAVFDLIVVDLQMPVMSGVDVVRELALRKFSGALIIQSSEASALLDSVKRLAKLSGIKVLGTLGKPLQLVALEKLLAEQAPQRAIKETRPISKRDTKRALQDGLFVPFYQPKIDLKTNRLTGFEVLTRLNQVEQRDSGAPADYLEAIDRHGFSVAFVFQLIERAAIDRLHWPDPASQVPLSFNLSPQTFQDAALVDQLIEKVGRCGFKPSDITLEVTENQLLEQTAASLEVLSALRLRGFGLSIDDFGTGATSNQQLRSFPFTELKIDGSFMLASDDDEFSRITVETSARLASVLGMKVVAEGVETPAMQRFAQRVGVHEVQGYLHGRPMTASRIGAWTNAFTSDRGLKVG